MRQRMRIGRDTHQGRERFALAAAGEKRELARFQEFSLARVDIRARREGELAELDTQPHALGHPPPQRHHPPSHLARELGQLAHAVQM